MKTIEEINEIAPYHPCEWQQGYGIWQSGYMAGQKDATNEQKSIDEDYFREVKKMVIDKASEVYEKKLRELKRILNDKYGAGDIISIGGSLIDFRKAVEAEA